jgi:molybdenum cofactor biosynthesis enzyme MoaA
MENKRIAREKKTIAAMMKCYCIDLHQPNADLCGECNELLLYAQTRLDKCVFGENKVNCTECMVHCYKKDMREKIKEVMRYAGPKMLIKHPVLSLNHIYQGFKGKWKNFKI